MDLVQHALDPSTTVMMWNAVTSESGKPFIIPIVGLLIGAAMMAAPATNTVGKLVLYFGAQSFMNIYMGWVMRTSVTVPAGTFIARTNSTLESDLTGCPAGFALTAMQQVISFVVFMLFFTGAWFTPYRYTPKKLNSTFEVFCVIVFGCVFALNIALNNFSLGYISIAVNLIIRSCLPLSTFLSQQGLALFNLYPFKPCRPKEIILMVIGVACAAVFTLARIMGSASQGKGSSNMVLGVCMCVASLLCGSLNLALAGVLGETKLNVFDTVAYMAIPATLFLLPIAMFVQKPVPGEWPKVFGVSHMSDWEILQGVWVLNKRTISWLVLSGVFSFVYNIIQFSIVHTLSPSATAFGGNFNKAALIFLTLLLPFLRVHELPGPPYIQVIWGAVVVNIAAFSYYSYLQIKAKEDAGKQHRAQLIAENDEEDGESTSVGSSASGSASSEEQSFWSQLLGKFGWGEAGRGTRVMAR
uniref:Sugar phosphate transporter domain-containing protein n=1 Tax=Zooxanthella nutricula TaxID=1333877 RepID=A0A7S2IFD0_9DINO|mmetsp:Transcript_1728/g.5093  ORF Transcript_1728/g.5093 Transcript_1728/m.5093 type:complete len:470 (+) Transcript_1728:73-1482(+)